MGLKIQRTASSPVFHAHSSTLMSAHYEYRLFNENDSQAMTVGTGDFADRHRELDDEAVKRLFDHIWEKVKADRRRDVVLDLSQIQSVTQRFERELAYLRRQLRPQGRSARLVNLSADCDQARSLEIA